MLNKTAKNNYAGHKAGFTLIEALVSMSIGVMLLGAVLSIYVLAIRSLSSSENKSELTQNSRIIIERLTRDIRQARSRATIIPSEKDDPENPPPNYIELQDGHNSDTYQYIKYYLNGTDLRRQVIQYYFSEAPETLVPYDSEDDFGNPPETNVIEDFLVGQYVSNIIYYGDTLIAVELTLQKSNNTRYTKAEINGRNL